METISPGVYPSHSFADGTHCIGVSELLLVYNGDILEGVFFTRSLEAQYQADLEAGEV
jgi:hypothetical protein